jgi:hypothetical protein
MLPLLPFRRTCVLADVGKPVVVVASGLLEHLARRTKN